MTEEELYTLQITTRVERLQKLIKFKAPKYVVASEVVLVLKAAVGYCGDAFGQVLQEWLLGMVRLAMWRCTVCGSDVDFEQESGLCKACLTQAEDEIGAP